MSHQAIERFLGLADSTVGIRSHSELYNYGFVSMASGQFTSVSAAAGYLNNILIGNTSMGSFTVYDRASGASGAVIAAFDAPFTQQNVFVGAKVLNGLTIAVTSVPASGSTKITAVYR